LNSLTDVPSFLTRGPSTPNGGTLCVFDPHCSYVPIAEPDMPGMQIQDLELLKDSYKDVYDTYLQNELQAAIGTWFRLPLRNEAMAKESSLIFSLMSDMSS
jgi:sacsin